MNLKIQKINQTIILESEKYFWDSFCDKLKKEKYWTYNESLVARYLIEKNNNVCFSISHKKDLVFIWTNSSKIWIDIEIMKIRWTDLLYKFRSNEYNILEKKDKTICWKTYDWDLFYILWTAKESIIKFDNLKLDNIEDIFLIKSEKIEKDISWIIFNKKLTFKFLDKIYKTYSWSDWNIFYWVCF